MTMSLKLYELCGADASRVFSPYCWRIRMALTIKGLDFSVPWRFTETERLAFAAHDKVPVLVDGDRAVPESWDIVQYLDATRPSTPSLLRGNPAPYRGMERHGVAVGVAKLVVSDIPAPATPAGRHRRWQSVAIFDPIAVPLVKGM